MQTELEACMQQSWTIEQQKEIFMEYLRNGRFASCPLDHSRIQVNKLAQPTTEHIMVFACPTCRRAFQSNELM